MDIYQAFRRQEVLGEVPPGKIVLAVSGGSDSMAMLHLVSRLKKERHWRVLVAHIQHHLRGKESMQDEEFVGRAAKKLHLPFVTRSIKVKELLKQKKYRRLGLEAAARDLRYGALSEIAREWNARAIFTAHTADDQAETFLLNLLRGSGFDGLCGIHPFRPLSGVTGKKEDKKILIVRPCLEFSKEALTRYLGKQNLRGRFDRSNQNLRFRRNWVRANLLPVLLSVQPKAVEKIGEAAANLRENKKILDLKFDEMKKNALDSDGKNLDLPVFFRYNTALKRFFLHRLCPQGSLRQIVQNNALLEKERQEGKKRFFLISSLFV